MSSSTAIDLRAFAADDLAEAGRLLAARHRRHRQDEPLLSPRYEQPGECERELAKVWQMPDSSGAVATAHGRMVGYLLGAPKPHPVWGPNVWVESAGHAAEDAEVVRDLYGFAAARWYDEGRTAHYVLAPAHDGSILGAWSRLAFGQQQIHGVQPATRRSAAGRGAVSIRPPTRADIPVLAKLDATLPAHQALSPVFSAGTAATLEALAQDWEESIDDPRYATFLAERAGRVVGSATGCALNESSTHNGLSVPDRAGFLSFAAVLPEARGTGAGRALNDAVLTWSADSGYECVVTDWRVTNLLSSRAWPALGYRPHLVRMHRLIGH